MCGACVGERHKFDTIGVGFSKCGSKFDSMGVTGGVPKRVRAGENTQEQKQNNNKNQVCSAPRGVGNGERPPERASDKLA